MDISNMPPVATEEGQFCRSEIQFENETAFNAAWSAATSAGAYVGIVPNDSTRIRLMYAKSTQQNVMEAIRGAVTPAPKSDS